MTDKIDTESFRVLDRLRELRVSHRDLDYLIDRLQDDPMVDQLRIRRLKRRKLLLKDMIMNLESDMIPDLDA
jgi:hypothetical protein